jgi:hypothetical protein
MFRREVKALPSQDSRLELFSMFYGFEVSSPNWLVRSWRRSVDPASVCIWRRAPDDEDTHGRTSIPYGFARCSWTNCWRRAAPGDLLAHPSGRRLDYCLDSLNSEEIRLTLSKAQDKRTQNSQTNSQI